MPKTVISVENLSKSYRLGQIGTGTLSRDLEVWWAKVRGKPNPLLKIGQTDHGNQDGQTLWALQDVSFQVQQGEVLGIIGRNGAGKSTLLKILSRVTAPTSGQVKVKGRIASLLEVGTGFHPELTGRENIFLNGAILGMSKQEVQRKFDEIVSFAEVEKFVDTPVKRYSSGMYVRLAFAVAAHLESEILLVDEVLAVGDAEFQKKCLGKMGDVATKEGRTVLFVSHNMTSINSLCNRAILLFNGKKFLDGKTELIVNKYLSQKGEDQTEKIWKDKKNAPGSINVKLHSVKVYSEKGDQDQFSSDQRIIIDIEFWNLRNNSKLVTEFKLLDSSGVIVLESFNTPEANTNSQKYVFQTYDQGLFRSRCILPGNFLNNKQYFVSVIIVSLNPPTIEVNENEIVSFNVHDSGRMRTPGLSGTWFGLIRTPLEWINTKIHKDE